MRIPGDDDPSERLVGALSNGLDCLHALVLGLDAGAADLGVDGSTWDSAMTALEWGMNEVRTNPAVTTGYLLTEEDVARVRLLREQVHQAMHGGVVAPELRQLAVQTLETMSGPDWAEKMRRGRQLPLV